MKRKIFHFAVGKSLDCKIVVASPNFIRLQFRITLVNFIIPFIPTSYWLTVTTNILLQYEVSIKKTYEDSYDINKAINRNYHNKNECYAE